MAKRKAEVEEFAGENEAADYGDILDRTFEDLPEDKLLPGGSWLLKGRSAGYSAPREEGKNGKVLFFYIPQAPMEGVDTAELEALGPDYDVSENQIVFTIWIEFNRDWRKVENHLRVHGTYDPTKSIKENFKAFRGSEVVAHLDTRTYERKAPDGTKESVTENSASNFRSVE